VTLLPANVTTTITSLNLGGTPSNGPPRASRSTSTSRPRPTRDAVTSSQTEPLPTVTKEFAATICWFGENALQVGQRLRLKHTTKVTPVRVSTLEGVLDIATLKVGATSSLVTNEIGLATLQTAEPIVVDDYRDNRVTGSFVLIDEVTNATVAAGMVGRASFL